jgi:hypothetical protein
MKKNNIISLILIVALIIIYIIKIVQLDIKTDDLYKKMDEMQNNINTMSEDLVVTQGILNGHITNELSKDIGGEY